MFVLESSDYIDYWSFILGSSDYIDSHGQKDRWTDGQRNRNTGTPAAEQRVLKKILMNIQVDGHFETKISLLASMVTEICLLIY